MSARPAVKRTYGARKAVPLSSTQPEVSASSSSPRQRPSQASTSAMHRNQSSASASQWSEVLEEGDTSDDRCRGVDTPQTSPELFKGKGVSRGAEAVGGIQHASSTPVRPVRDRIPGVKGPAPTIRSFFGVVSPKKRAMHDSDSDGEVSTRRSPRVARRKISTESTESNLSSSSSRSTLSSSTSASSSASTSRSTIVDVKPRVGTTGKAKLEQLYLDPFETPGHATLSCATCAMSYARTLEDMALHDRHHKKVIAGCDWIAADGKGVTVIDEAVQWGGKSGGKILMVDATAGGLLGKKLVDVLSTVDTELSATSLSPTQLAQCKVFLFVTPQRKVIACAVVQRIQLAYRVVLSDGGAPKDDLLRFGEEEGAVFCSPQALPTLLGVHRIWCSSSHRRSGLASTLLDAVAGRYIYGCPILRTRRAEDVAFSQPTGAGMSLARSWTGTNRFRVFID